MRIETITFPRINPETRGEYIPWTRDYGCVNVGFQLPQSTQSHHDLRIPDHVNYLTKRQARAERNDY